MIEPPGNFVFACPHCQAREAQPLSLLRTWSFCRHCHKPVMLVDANGASASDESSAPKLQSSKAASRFVEYGRQAAVAVIRIPLGVILLPFYLVWLILVAVARLIEYLTKSSREVYERHGWRGFARYRLSHFLIVTTLVAMVAGLIGQRYVQEWERQREAERQAKRITAAIAELERQKADFEHAVSQLNGKVRWFDNTLPPEFATIRHPEAYRLMRNRALVDFHYYPAPPGARAPKPGPPSASQWQENLEPIVAYPHFESLSLRDPQIDAATFAALPASPPLVSVVVIDASLPLEGYAWCARCPELRHLEFRLEHTRDLVNSPQDDTLLALSQAVQLETLILDRAEISSRGIEALTKLSELRELHLETTESLTAESLEMLAAMPLERLSLSGTAITADHLDALAKSEMLQELIVDPLMINDSGLEELQARLPETLVTRRTLWKWPSFRLPHPRSTASYQQN